MFVCHGDALALADSIAVGLALAVVPLGSPLLSEGLPSMIRLPVLTIKRIMLSMVDAADRKVLAEWAIWMIAAIIVLIVAAGALGIALSVFEATRRL